MSKIRKSGKTINGERVGRWYFYYENGLPYLYGSYIDGKEVGLWYEWYENGNLKEILNFVDGNYIPIYSATESGEILMKESTGIRIEKFGARGHDVFKTFYKEGALIKQEKVESANYLSFE